MLQRALPAFTCHLSVVMISNHRNITACNAYACVVTEERQHIMHAWYQTPASRRRVQRTFCYCNCIMDVRWQQQCTCRCLLNVDSFHFDLLHSRFPRASIVLPGEQTAWSGVARGWRDCVPQILRPTQPAKLTNIQLHLPVSANARIVFSTVQYGSQ